MHAARARARLIGGFPRDSAKSLTSSRYYAYRVLVPDGNRFVRRDGGADGGKTARTIDPTILPTRVLRASRGAFPADLRDFVRGCGGRRLPRDRGVVNGVVRVVGWWLQRRDVAAIKVALGREADRRIILTRSFVAFPNGAMRHFHCFPVHVPCTRTCISFLCLCVSGYPPFSPPFRSPRRVATEFSSIPCFFLFSVRSAVCRRYRSFRLNFDGRVMNGLNARSIISEDTMFDIYRRANVQINTRRRIIGRRPLKDARESQI